jgi:large subunit ribosomal protein L10
VSREKKAQDIDKLAEVFSQCSVGILADYRGLTVPEATALRRKLRDSSITFQVVKNTLARLAASKAGKGMLADCFQGPTAIAFGYGEITEPAKALMQYIRDSRDTALRLKGGFLTDRLLSAEDVATLSTLPGREEIIAKMLGGMQAPIVNLASHLAGPIRGFIGVLQARKRQIEAVDDSPG